MLENNSPWRAVVIGCGRIGADVASLVTGSSRIQCHAKAYVDSPHTTLSGFCDLDRDALQRAGKNWGVSACFVDVEKLLTEVRPEIVSICTPVNARLQLLETVLAASSVRAVLMEKPIASSKAEAAEICRLAADSEATLSINFIRRFPSVYGDIGRRIRDGSFGRIQHISGYYTKGIINNGGHILDLLRWWFGSPLRAWPLSPLREAIDPDLDFAVEFAKNVVGWVRCLDAQSYNIFELDILGTGGRIVLRDLGHQLDEYSILDATAQHGFKQLALKPVSTHIDLAGALKVAIEDLISAVEAGRKPKSSVEDGCAALALSLDLIEAAKKTNFRELPRG